MNAIIKKFKSTTALASGEDDAISALERRVNELNALVADLTGQILSLEKTTTARVDQRADIAAADALLSGEPFKLSHTPTISQVAALHAERDAVRIALKVGNQRLQKLRDTREIEICASYRDEIAEVERRRILCALDLQAINRERETLRSKIRSAGGGNAALHTDGSDLLGIGDIQDEVLWGCDRLIADGIVSASEIERAKAR
jgi:hypothetical protein